MATAKKRERPTAVERLRKALAKKQRELTAAYKTAEPELVETDVRYCGLMEEIWLLKFQASEAEMVALLERETTADDENDERDDPRGTETYKLVRAEGRVASTHASEWSRRKNAALVARKLDLLPRILARLNARDQLATRFGEFSRRVS